MAHWFSNRTSTLADAPPQVAPDVSKVDHKALLQLMQSVSGAFYLPCDAGYAKAAAQQDPLFQRRPVAVAMCQTVEDVQACIRWCNSYGVSATFRSGGHSTAGFSVLDDRLTVDLSGLNTIKVDSAAPTVEVGPGVNFAALNAALDGYKLHVPGGGCGTVCVAGYMQGGGYGFTSRCFGMNCDNVREIEFVTKTGERQTANATQNTDLFWAFRGGSGGNFGVVTKITYSLVPLGDIWGFGLVWDLDKAPAALSVMQAELMRGGPDEIGYMVFIMPRAEASGGTVPKLMVRGMCIAGEEKAKKLLANLEKTGGTYERCKTASYAVLNDYLIADLEPKGLDSIMELKVSNYIARKLLPAEWKQVASIFTKAPKIEAARAETLVLEPYGGRIAEVSARTNNAFIHRDVDMNFVVDSFYGSDAEKPLAEQWLDMYRNFLRGPTGVSNGEVYQNYPEATLADWAKCYFGKALPRLRQIRWQVDAPTAAYPDGFFSYPQSIPPQQPD